MKIIFEGKQFEFHTNENGDIVIEGEGNIILNSKPEKKSPFERVGEGEAFYSISGVGKIMQNEERLMYSPGMYYDCANYCTDAELLRRRALYEKVERCLWRFSMENGGSGDYYPILTRTRDWNVVRGAIFDRFGPTFKTREICTRAIEEVIKPILDGIENEIFVWEGVKDEEN